MISSDLGLNMVSGMTPLETTPGQTAKARIPLSPSSLPRSSEKVTPQSTEPAELSRNLDDTIRWWREWTSQVQLEGPELG